MIFNRDIKNQIDKVERQLFEMRLMLEEVSASVYELCNKSCKCASNPVEKVEEPQDSQCKGITLIKWDEVFQPVPIEAYKDKYVVSNYGRVVSLVSLNEVKPSKGKNGYSYVRLKNDNGSTLRSAAKLARNIFGDIKSIEEVKHAQKPKEDPEVFKPIILNGISTNYGMNRKKEIIDVNTGDIIRPYSVSGYSPNVELPAVTKNGMRLRINLDEVYAQLFLK